jgi:hypothetical protein
MPYVPLVMGYRERKSYLCLIALAITVVFIINICAITVVGIFSAKFASGENTQTRNSEFLGLSNTSRII